MATASESRIRNCVVCPRKNQEEAEMRCLDCKINMCIRCFIAHKNTPVFKKHKYENCDVESENETDVKSHVFSDETSNTGQKCSMSINKNQSQLRNESKIFESKSGLEKIFSELQLGGKPWQARSVKKSMKVVLRNLKHLKTVEISKEGPTRLVSANGPNRLALVNDKIWIKSDRMRKIHIFDQELKLLNNICPVQSDCDEWMKDINVIQQVNNSDVFVASEYGLFQCNTNGKFGSKIMDGAFSDICVDEEKVLAIDYEENKIIYLCKDGNVWKEERHFILNDPDKEFMKTLHMLCDDLLVCFYGSDKIQKYNKDTLVNEKGSYGSGSGQFQGAILCGSDSRGHLIICDTFCNNRLQMVDHKGVCEEIVIDGVANPWDFLVFEESLYVLHSRNGMKLSKYKINYI